MLCAERRLARRGDHAAVASIDELVGTLVVAQVGVEDDIPQLAGDAGVTDAAQRFDAPIEIALHQVRAADVECGIAAVLEVIESRMFEEPADDRSDADP